MSSLELEVGWSRVGLGPPKSGQDERVAAFIIQLVSLSTGIGPRDIATATRNCADAARARQISMYLAHTACAWPLARVGSAFGRDRSTASYACRRVEDLRENDRFDAGLTRLERCIRAAPVDPSGMSGSGL